MRVNGEGDPMATEGGRPVDALNHSADLVTADVDDAVPQDMRDALNALGRRGAGAGGSDHRTCAARSVQRRGRPAERQQTAALDSATPPIAICAPGSADAWRATISGRSAAR